MNPIIEEHFNTESFVLEAINNYFLLKNKYESEIQKQKDKIMDNSLLSRKEKREAFLQIPKKCMLCKREGGTLFTNENRTLKAICNNKVPCPLDIEIKIGHTVSAFDVAEKIENEYDIKKFEIIRTKLDLLFNIISEEQAVKHFEKMKRDFSKLSNAREQTLYELLMATDNPDENARIDSKTVEMYENINEYKRLIQSYKLEDKTEYLTEAMEIYLQKIIPNQNDIRELKYPHSRVEIDTTIEKQPIYNVIQKHHELVLMEHESSKIIKYKVNLDTSKKKKIEPVKKAKAKAKVKIIEEEEEAEEAEKREEVKVGEELAVPLEVENIEVQIEPVAPAEIEELLGNDKASFFFRNLPESVRAKLQFDKEALYSVTDSVSADAMTSILSKLPGLPEPSKMSITDITACVGGNVISFARTFGKVTAIEIDPTRAKMLLNNVTVALPPEYSSRVEVRRGDGVQEATKQWQEIIFMDPPWGGLEYGKTKNLHLFLSGRDIAVLTRDLFLSQADYVAVKAPVNFDVDSFRDDIGSAGEVRLYTNFRKMILLVVKRARSHITLGRSQSPEYEGHLD